MVTNGISVFDSVVVYHILKILRLLRENQNALVIPAQAGIQKAWANLMDPGLRRDDGIVLH